MLDICKFIAENAGLNLIEALEKAYKLGQKDERGKVNKAIAEIEELETYDGVYIDRYVILEILDRNLGGEEDD